MKEAIELLRQQASSARDLADLHQRNATRSFAEARTATETAQHAETLANGFRQKAEDWDAAAAVLEENQ